MKLLPKDDDEHNELPDKLSGSEMGGIDSVNIEIIKYLFKRKRTLLLYKMT